MKGAGLRTLKICLALTFATSFAVSCVSVDVDDNETPDNLQPGPTIEFDPGNSIIPFPNNLLVNPMTGIVNIPEGCNESPATTATREGLLNSLNGFGVFKGAITVTFTEPVDPASLAGNVKLYKRAAAGMPIDPSAATEIPVVAIPSTTTRNSPDCMSSSEVDQAIFVPMIPLDGDGTYTVALTGAIQTAGGEAFQPSSTWQLIRGATNPVTLDEQGNIIADATPLDPFNPEDRATLEGVNLLWNAHAGAMAFLEGAGIARTDVHLAWDFNTQTTTRPLDPASPGSLAGDIASTGLLGVTSITGGDAEAFLIATFDSLGQNGAATCAQIGCANVGDIVGGGLSVTTYQTPTPNPLSGGAMIPGPWADPIAPDAIGPEIIEALGFVPVGTPPANGWPTIVFGHGLTRAKTDLIVIGSQLASAGFASIAIDWVAHGPRAIQISDDPALLCADVSAGPTALPQCYAPILSTDLAVTRDNLRQTVLNSLTLIEALKVCGNGGGNCGVFDDVDADRLGYMGQSLGAIIGTMTVSMSPDIKAAVLNVGGVGLIDVVENTDNLGIRCSIVNGLIEAGIISGTVNETCLGTDWLMDPGYRSFAVIGRWAADPADGANFLPGLATKTVLLQEVIGDAVVPNFVTDQQAALMGLSAQAADMTVDPTIPSAAITTNPTDTKWVTYDNLPPAGPFPGNSYAHGSLLAPASADAAGSLGTGLMQTDAIVHLLQNL